MVSAQRLEIRPPEPLRWVRPDTVKLSKGRVATIREATGRDLEKGAAVASSATNPMSLMMGVASQVTTIDGKAVVYEDILDLPLSDVLLLVGELVGNVKELSRLSVISS